MSKREELDLFIEKADELIDSKYILADVKIASLLKTIAASDTLLALFKNCLTDFDFEEACKKYLVRNKFLSADKGEFIIPPNPRDLLAFIFYVLVEIDAKRIVLSEFINKYFFVDGSYSSGYEIFITAMIKPFRNSVKGLMEEVLGGKLQDPIEAFIEAEDERARQKEQEEIDAQKKLEVDRKVLLANVSAVKEYLFANKLRVKESNKEQSVKDDINLIIDMLANVIDSEDKDAINYAFVAYKYMFRAHKLLLIKDSKKLMDAVNGVINAL